ncbi:MAG: glycosyltransferase [Bacteroidales bacterium]|nr:glycosyltransferase [Bacteroidales bacterium]
MTDRKPKAAFSVTNCICFDQRVLKIAGVVESMNCTVTIIGRHLGSCCDANSVPFATRRFRMIFRKGFMFYKFFNIRLFFFLLVHRFDILVANDLDTLLPNYLIARMKKLPLVYDSHEYFTGVPELQERDFVRGVWKIIEKNTFPKLRHVMTVSESIADRYEKEYGVRPAVVRNCSRNSAGINPMPVRELRKQEGQMLLIYQGGGINIDRGGEELIEAVSRLDNILLLVAGGGDVLERLKQLASGLNCTDRVRFIDRIPWHELMRYTKSADAGLTLDRDTNPNYRFSLPNKLFDYISAGIPVIAGDLPEVSKIIRENDCGLVMPEVTPDEIVKAVTRLRDNPEYLNKLRQNAVKASVFLNWETESEKVKKFYYGILKEV